MSPLIPTRTHLRISPAVLLVALWCCAGPGPAAGGQPASRPAAGRLQVHAIAWSEIPERRVAVVGDQVLREGMSAGGIELLEIRPDRVILRVNGDRITREIERAVDDPPLADPGAAPEAGPLLPENGRPNHLPPRVYHCAVELANIRRVPRMDAPVVARIKRGTRLQGIGQEGMWLKLRLLDGSQGWIRLDLVD